MLRVDVDRLYGNAADVQVTRAGDGVLELSFAPSAKGGPEALWFSFHVTPDAALTDTRLRLVLKHATNILGGVEDLLHHRPSDHLKTIRPVLRSAAQDWTRLDAGDVHETDDGRRQVRWLIDVPKGPFEVAFCYPYGLADVDQLVAETNGYWQRDTIGVSPNDRPLVRLSNRYRGDAETPGLFLFARQHANEVSASWVLDGFLRYVAEQPDAPLIWVVPLADIDAIETGVYGKDSFPHDMNRAWGDWTHVKPMRHEVLVYHRDFQRWADRCRPTLALDFHAPHGTNNSGLFFFGSNPDKSPERFQAESVWTTPIAEALTPEYASPELFPSGWFPNRWGHNPAQAFTQYVWETFDIPALTIEVPYALAGEVILTRERYREAGRRVALAVLEVARQRVGA